MTTPHRRPGIACEVLDGEALLFDPDTGQTHRLNRTALDIWNACDGRSATHDLAARLTADYAVSFDQSLEDVEQTIATLACAGLLTVNG